MPSYAIIEVDAGLTVVETHPGESAEEAAVRNAGLLVDPGPFPSYDDAYDAIVAMEHDEEADSVE
jgi:hypothetical protein